MPESANATANSMPLYLKQVRVRNYAPLRDAKIDLKLGLNIIIGPNGIGKTRFINLSSQLVDWFATPKIGAGCELVLGYDKDIRIVYRYPLGEEDPELGFSSERVAELEVIASYGEKQNVGEDIFDVLMDWNLPLYDTVLAQHGTPLQKLPLVDQAATLTFGEMSRMSVEPEIRLPVSGSVPLIIQRLLSAIRTAFTARRRSTHKPVFTFSVTEAKTEIERIVDTYLSFLAPALINYSPIEQVRLSESYQIYINEAQQELIIKGLVLEYFLNGSWLPFEALSDGTKRMFYLISQLKTPRAEFNRKASFPLPFSFFTRASVVFLEEPELGIHPDQLQKLLSLIREVSKEHQVIMTTHSPQVLNMLTTRELDRITICELDPKKGTQFRKLSSAKRAKAKDYMQNDSYLSDFWLYSNLEAE